MKVCASLCNWKFFQKVSLCREWKHVFVCRRLNWPNERTTFTNPTSVDLFKFGVLFVKEISNKRVDSFYSVLTLVYSWIMLHLFLSSSNRPNQILRETQTYPILEQKANVTVKPLIKSNQDNNNNNKNLLKVHRRDDASFPTAQFSNHIIHQNEKTKKAHTQSFTHESECTRIYSW